MLGVLQAQILVDTLKGTSVTKKNRKQKCDQIPSVSVSYGCVTNHTNAQWLKTITIYQGPDSLGQQLGLVQ